MKMSSKLFGDISSAVSQHDTKEHRDAYRSGDYPRSELVHDVNKRYRWDLFHHADHIAGGNHSRNAYGEGLNDTHIDTALKSIVPKL